MKQLSLLTLALLLALPHRTAEACMNCVNSVTEVKLPFLNSLLLVFTGWLVLTLIFCRPLTKGTRRFYYFGIPFLILGVLVVVPLGMGVPIILCWIIYLPYQILQFFSTRQERIFKNFIPLSVNIIALLLSFTLIFVTTARANTTPELIKSLGGISPFYPATVHQQISRLSQRGPEAVTPLSDTLAANFERYEQVSAYPTARMAYCLREIGGPQAEATLQDIIEHRMKFKDSSSAKWEAAVCCLYAECAGERAVPVLTDILKQAERNQNHFQKRVALIALARTRDQAAIETVLNHVPFLQEDLQADLTSRWSAAMISLTLQALAEGQASQHLIQSPVYHRLMLGLRPELKSESGIVWNQKWDGELDPEALKTHWATILSRKD